MVDNDGEQELKQMKVMVLRCEIDSMVKETQSMEMKKIKKPMKIKKETKSTVFCSVLAVLVVLFCFGGFVFSSVLVLAPETAVASSLHCPFGMLRGIPIFCHSSNQIVFVFLLPHHELFLCLLQQ